MHEEDPFSLQIISGEEVEEFFKELDKPPITQPSASFANNTNVNETVTCDSNDVSF